jgi:predicted aspartyl protease
MARQGDANLVTWRTLLAASAVLGLATAGSIPGAGAANCKLVKVEDWPTRVQRNLLLVDGAINGRKISVMLDTGSMRTLIFRAAAVRLQLPLSGATRERMFGVGGETKVDVALVDEFSVGQAAQKQLRILVAGEHDAGDDVAVLLGEDFLQAFDVEFDLAHNAVRLFQPKDCDRVSLAYWERTGASEVPFEALDVNFPEIILAVQINGQPIKAKLDSGAALSLLDKSDAARLGVMPETPGVVATDSGFGMGKKAVDAWIGPFRSFTIGNETIQDTQIRFSDIYKDVTYRATGSNLPQRIRVWHSMLLGADFLRSHRVLVAHSQRKIYFTYTGGPVFQLNRPPVPGNEPRSADSATPGTSEN